MTSYVHPLYNLALYETELSLDEISVASDILFFQLTIFKEIILCIYVVGLTKFVARCRHILVNIYGLLVVFMANNIGGFMRVRPNIKKN